MNPQARIVLFAIIGFGVLSLSSLPANARIGCSASYAACVATCGEGRLCRAHCESQRRACENQKTAPGTSVRPRPMIQ